jgi:hypothetical protein
MENQEKQKKYKSFDEFMDQPIDAIKLALLNAIEPHYLGVIKKVIICDSVDYLSEILKEHFNLFQEQLFKMPGNIRPNGGYKLDSGLCPARDLFTKKVGYMNEAFEMMIPAIYESVNAFNSEGFAVVEYGQKVGLIDLSGDWIILPEYKEIFVTREGMQYICNDGGDIYMYELDGDRIVGEPYEMDRFYPVTPKEVAATKSDLYPMLGRIAHGFGIPGYLLDPVGLFSRK